MRPGMKSAFRPRFCPFSGRDKKRDGTRPLRGRRPAHSAAQTESSKLERDEPCQLGSLRLFTARWCLPSPAARKFPKQQQCFCGRQLPDHRCAFRRRWHGERHQPRSLGAGPTVGRGISGPMYHSRLPPSAADRHRPERSSSPGAGRRGRGGLSLKGACEDAACPSWGRGGSPAPDRHPMAHRAGPPGGAATRGAGRQGGWAPP